MLRTMTLHRLFCSLLFAAAFYFPRARAAGDLPEDMVRVLRNYEAAWAQRDAIALSNLFTEDGYVLPNRQAPVQGRDNIQAYYDGHGGELHLRALHHAVEGNIGFIIGTYSLAKDGPQVGKFTLTLSKNGDGIWMISSDMDNPNQ